jgi:hypothetical protein
MYQLRTAIVLIALSAALGWWINVSRVAIPEVIWACARSRPDLA